MGNGGTSETGIPVENVKAAQFILKSRKGKTDQTQGQLGAVRVSSLCEEGGFYYVIHFLVKKAE